MKETKQMKNKKYTKWEQQIKTKSANRTQRQKDCSNMSPKKK